MLASDSDPRYRIHGNRDAILAEPRRLPASVVGRGCESLYVPMRGPQVGGQDLDMCWEAALRKLSGGPWRKAPMTSDAQHGSVEEAETSATSAFGSARLLLAAEHAVDIGAATLRQAARISVH